MENFKGTRETDRYPVLVAAKIIIDNLYFENIATEQLRGIDNQIHHWWSNFGKILLSDFWRTSIKMTVAFRETGELFYKVENLRGTRGTWRYSVIVSAEIIIHNLYSENITIVQLLANDTIEGRTRKKYRHAESKARSYSTFKVIRKLDLDFSVQHDIITQDKTGIPADREQFHEAWGTDLLTAAGKILFSKLHFLFSHAHTTHY